MKKLLTILAIASVSTAVQAQFNTPWTETTSNALQSGYIGIGTNPSSSTTVLPNFNLQVHGVADYFTTITGQGPGGPPATSINTNNGNDKELGNNNVLKSTTNHGPTSRIGLTNSFTGSGEFDGGIIRMSKNDLSIANWESGDLSFASSGLIMRFSNVSNRISINGNANNTGNKLGKFNIQAHLDNGLSVESMGTDKFGIRVKVKDDNSNIFEGYGGDDNEANFQVTGAGEVYARKYITTLNPFPDYVFQPDYELKTFSELRDFINTNKHLPNMPTALEVEENGADIGEINRLLVEKVEELTLYILELEERVVEVESTDEEEPALEERITRLEKMISNLSEEQK
ncbi:hypothetical protein ERX46_00505 [Brumimicrobium glaciale]|uniref:BZIP transcription factor n=1 Tax=Brumimicrobium glaciale TaxID=200475 RepID=A0A4Q4KRG7_9FLAO|nr:hypothetical protein [Brumimicrobium glaciale]RYM35502.1 hypothetical protein ERX46_00505 [Brumimicrobium glaciale]